MLLMDAGQELHGLLQTSHTVSAHLANQARNSLRAGGGWLKKLRYINWMKYHLLKKKKKMRTMCCLNVLQTMYLYLKVKLVGIANSHLCF